MEKKRKQQGSILNFFSKKAKKKLTKQTKCPWKRVNNLLRVPEIKEQLIKLLRWANHLLPLWNIQRGKIKHLYYLGEV